MDYRDLMRSAIAAENRGEMPYARLRAHPELTDLIKESQQEGATHILFIHNSAMFYRVLDKKVEVRLAKHSLDYQYKWLRSARTWKECKNIPKNALSVPKFLEYRFWLWRIKSTFLSLRDYLGYFFKSLIRWLFPPIPTGSLGLNYGRPQFEVVREMAYFRCDNCENIFDSIGHLGGPFRKTCPKCESQKITRITYSDYISTKVRVDHGQSNIGEEGKQDGTDEAYSESS